MSSDFTFADRISRALQSFAAYRKRPKDYLARIEFWVYLPGDKLPEQEAIMQRMMTDNPYKTRGDVPIGGAEGLVFSDVRTHIALILKTRNPQIFRDDLYPETVQPTPEQVEAMTSSRSLVKVSYISEEPLANLNHIGFITHAADAIAELGGGTLVYDLVAERTCSVEQFGELILSSPRGRASEQHVRVLWVVDAEGGHAETRGLRKIGVPELVTTTMEHDQKVLIEAVLEQAAEAIWQSNGFSAEFTVSVFEDQFKIVPSRVTPDFNFVRVLRIQ